MLLAIAVALLGAPGDLQVTNIEAGTLVRYPVVILRGNAPRPEVVVGTGWKAMSRFPASQGKFAAFVELKPGKNMVLLSSGPEVLKLRLDYRPMSTPYRVACLYLAPRDETTDFDAPPGDRANQYGEKLDTVLKLLQSFTAESMNDAGFGRLTFPLELDAKDRIVVHVIKSPKTGVDLRTMSDSALWDSFNAQTATQYPGATIKSFAVMSFSRYDPAASVVRGTADLGKDGMVLLGGQNLSAWPTSLKDVPATFEDATSVDGRFRLDETDGRGTMWALSSNTIGDALRRLGQTFGLPESTDPTSVMSKSSDLISRAFTTFEAPCKLHDHNFYFKPEEVVRWDPTSAALLSKSLWFQPDGSGIR